LIILEILIVILRRQYFPNAYRTFDEILRNISLVFVNVHFSSTGPRPNLPNMVEIGGIQTKPKPDPLPQVN
jgi:glucuronosyltransferase